MLGIQVTLSNINLRVQHSTNSTPTQTKTEQPTIQPASHIESEFHHKSACNAITAHIGNKMIVYLELKSDQS